MPHLVRDAAVNSDSHFLGVTVEILGKRAKLAGSMASASWAGALIFERGLRQAVEQCLRDLDVVRRLGASCDSQSLSSNKRRTAIHFVGIVRDLPSHPMICTVLLSNSFRKRHLHNNAARHDKSPRKDVS